MRKNRIYLAGRCSFQKQEFSPTRKLLFSVQIHILQNSLTLFSIWGGGRGGALWPPTGCSYAAPKQLDETFRLLVSMYWASENVTFNHLGLNSLPRQPYC